MVSSDLRTPMPTEEYESEPETPIDRHVTFAEPINSDDESHSISSGESERDVDHSYQNTSFQNFINKVKSLFSFTVLYMIARILLFFWIFCFFSVFSILIMLWLMYSILEVSSESSMKSIS